MTTRNEYLRAARLQHYWASLARRDERYNAARAAQERRHGHFVEYQNFHREATVCHAWAQRRDRWAEEYLRKTRRR